MLNEEGISFVETLLTVVILFTIASTIIPISSHFKTNLYDKKLELHASEVAYEAVKMVLHDQRLSGIKEIDQVKYYWSFDGQQICVEFNNSKEVKTKCIK